MKHGKKYNASAAKYDLTKKYDVASACKMVQDMKYAKFDETIECHISLRLEKNATVRDTLVFPNQFRGEKKVLVFCKGDKVKDGWLDFDVAVATPDMMKDVGRLGMVLGRKGLMPNPKTGTVTPNVAQAVAELKKGRTEFRADKSGIVHIAVGKCSMDSEKVVENVNTLLSEISKRKPVGTANFVSSVSVSSSMGPGVWVDYKEGE